MDKHFTRLIVIA